MKVLWSDPGERVGWAIFEVSNLGPKPKLELDVYGIMEMQDFALWLLDHAAEFDLIGFETYAIRMDKLLQHAGSDVPTLQLVGMIRLAVWRARQQTKTLWPELVEQSPGIKKKGLGAVRIWLPGALEIVQEALNDVAHDDGHHGDAILHGAAWFHERFYEGKDRSDAAAL